VGEKSSVSFEGILRGSEIDFLSAAYTRVSFKYDPFGRRIYKSSSSGTSIYAYDSSNVVEETNSSGTVVARYSQGLNIDEPLVMLRSSATSYYHADGLGSVTSLSNGAGSLVQTYGYDAFGKQTTSTGSLTNPFQYTARELDVETSLYFYRARYYDPQIGRFLGEDPLGLDEGPNLYAYVTNNPVTNIDPSGRLKIDKSCKGKCVALGGGGPNNPKQLPTLQNVEEVLQREGDLACSNLQGITDPKLRACIKKSCDNGTVKCKNDCDPDSGGYSSGKKLGLFPNRTANLCPGRWPDWTPAVYAGQAIIHEFAHGCGWEHGQAGGVPYDPGKGKK
jgi:RHS repeat-associated protein